MPIFDQENHARHHAASCYLTRSQRKILFFFLKCAIMVVVISIFLFFLGFAAIVLLHFLFMSSTVSRRCARLFEGNLPIPSKTETETETLALLPDVPYSAATFSSTSDCAICLDSFQEGDECRSVPVCKHLFHAKCLDRWIRKKPSCPVCRTRVDLNPGGFSGSRSTDDRLKRLWTVNFEEGTSY